MPGGGGAHIQPKGGTDNGEPKDHIEPVFADERGGREDGAGHPRQVARRAAEERVELRQYNGDQDRH